MTVAIRYYTKSGNTKKLAEAVSEVAGVPAETTSVPLNEYVDLLFLGSSVYAAGVDEEVKNFINTLDPTKVGNVVCFSTAALLPSTYKQVCRLLEKRGVKVSEKEFHCRGRFKGFHKDRPNAEDLENLKKFVKEVL